MCRPMIALFVLSCPLFAQKGTVKLTDTRTETVEHVYKKTPQGELKLHGNLPKDWKATDKRPAIVFFFGGGWTSGAYTQFVPHCEYFASRGLVCFSADYRIKSKHGTTPDKCVEDGKSAVRWIRANAAKLGVDPDKIIAGGGSAGGHVAACTATVKEFDAEDDPKVSAKPNALMLFNPVLNLSLFTDRKVLGTNGEDFGKTISPTLHLTKDAPPAIVFFGTADRMLPMGPEYVKKCTELGVKAECYTAKDQPHGFFNKSPWAEATVKQADAWLEGLGYLKGDATVKVPTGTELKVAK